MTTKQRSDRTDFDVQQIVLEHYLETRQPGTAAELAAFARVSPTTIRRHLAKCNQREIDYVEVERETRDRNGWGGVLGYRRVWAYTPTRERLRLEIIKLQGERP